VANDRAGSATAARVHGAGRGLKPCGHPARVAAAPAALVAGPRVRPIPSVSLIGGNLPPFFSPHAPAAQLTLTLTTASPSSWDFLTLWTYRDVRVEKKERM
jgi:hypothetical protein